jgi:hypothetical protein
MSAKEFKIAQRGLPNDSEAISPLNNPAPAQMGRSTANLESRQFKSGHFPLQNRFNYQMLRDFDAANKAIDRGLQINPAGVGLWEIKSKLAIAEKGDLSVSEKAFQTVKSMPMGNVEKLWIAGARADVFLLERKYKEGLREAESLPDDLFTSIPAKLCSKYYLIGFAQKALRDEAGARAAFLKAKDLLEAQLKQSPDTADMHIQLAK